MHAEVDGERLTQAEIAAFFVLLSVAGNDTTRHTTSHAMLALATHPDQRRLLLEDLDGRMETAVEEFVRWATPVMTFRRTATRDTELGGQAIAEGDKVVLFYGSANRDERAFPDPNAFDVLRDPNRHRRLRWRRPALLHGRVAGPHPAAGAVRRAAGRLPGDRGRRAAIPRGKLR